MAKNKKPLLNLILTKAKSGPDETRTRILFGKTNVANSNKNNISFSLSCVTIMLLCVNFVAILLLNI